MDWIKIIQFYEDALSIEVEKASFQARIAGAKIR